MFPSCAPKLCRASVLLCAAVIAPAAAADNMFVNPGFESGDTSGWQVSGSHPDSFQVTEDLIHEGEFALVWSTGGYVYGAVGQGVAMIPADDVRELSVWARQENSTGSSQAGQLRVTYSDGTLIAANMHPPPGVWKKFDIAPLLAHGKFVVDVRVFVNGNFTDNAAWDDYSLMVGDPECDPPCEHGTCNEELTCDCADGWAGDACDEDVDECLDAPCDPNATCTNEPGSFACTCDEGFEGDGFACAPSDSDGDGVPDLEDNCVEVANTDQKDYDEDGLGDKCDADDDNDGLAGDDDYCPLEHPGDQDANEDGCVDLLEDLPAVLDEIPDGDMARQFRNRAESMVENADRLVERGNISAAVNLLEALQHQLEAQRGRQVSEDAADMLLAFLDNVIMDLLGGLP